MKLKKMAAATLAAVITAGSFAVSTFGSGNAVAASEQQSALSAPTNLRYEGGDIKWDEVDGAYGYILNVSDGETVWEREHNFTDADDLFVEFDRLCYENNIPLGTYSVKMCTFNASGEHSEWTSALTVTYAATLSAPDNLRLSTDDEETVLWDAVDGAYRYNIRITNEDGYNWSHYTNSISWGYYWYCGETGTYSFSVQAMDKDYNVSEWRSLGISHTSVERVDLAAPKNVRFDESGENILWDAVAGADYYIVQVETYTTDEHGNSYWASGYDCPTETHIDNWKSIVVPFPNAQYQIYVHAGKNDVAYDYNWSEGLDATYTTVLDETIDMPETIEVDGGYVKWNSVDNANAYWVNILVNGKQVDNDYHMVKAEDYSEELGYYIDVLNYLPEGNYDVELYVIDKNGGYNNKTYSLSLGQSSDESVWIPKTYSKNDILWDYDRIRHDETRGFWVRVKAANDGSVIKLEKTYGGSYYGFWDLPDGNYTVEVCAYEYGQIDEYNYGYRVGSWAEPRNVERHEKSAFDEENEKTTDVELPPEAADIPDEDKITSITINPDFAMKDKNDPNRELDLSKIDIKAEAIYDKENLKKAEDALGKTIEGNKHYNLLDLTLLYNGKDFSNGYDGLVKVIIPLPTGHKDKDFTCFRLTEVDGKLVKEVIEGTQTDDNYIIYLEHFSLYALVADANPDDGEEAPKNDPAPGETAPVTGSNNGTEDDNPDTGITLAAIPVIIAAGAAVLAVRKRRK